MTWWRRLEVLGWALAAATGVAAAVMALLPIQVPRGTRMTPSTAELPASTPRELVADPEVVIALNAFRPDRRPARRRLARAGEEVPPRPARPVLRLTGLALGQDPTAVIEGLPGTATARVVREGDVVGGLAIEIISDTGVVVAGLDTVWVLKVPVL